MDKKLFKNIIGNPKFIPGIYNYCDQWCERCPRTSRCANYALCEEQFADPKDRDISNEAFWQKRMGKWWITGSIQQKDYLRKRKMLSR